jgi:hypothetical protein
MLLLATYLVARFTLVSLTDAWTRDESTQRR